MMNSKEKYGKKIEYDPLWKGPMQSNRFSTDRIWLMVFSIFIGIYICIAIFGIFAGNYNILLVPMDIAGRACGIDPEVKDKSYFAFLNLNGCAKLAIHCSEGTCVSKCPTENYIIEKSLPLEQIKERLICANDINITAILSYDQLNILIKHNKCAEWYLKSEAIHHKCIPTDAWVERESDTISSKDLKVAKQHILSEENILINFYKDISTAGGPITISIVCAGIITLVYIVLLERFAVPFFYASFTIFCAIIGIAIYLLFESYAEYKSIINLFALFILIFIIVAVIIAVIYFRKKIYLACQLIKESSKAVMHLPLTLFIAVLSSFLIIAVLILGLYIFMNLASITTPVYKIEDLNDFDKVENCTCQNYTDSLLNNATCNPKVFNEKCLANGQPCQLLRCIWKDTATSYYLYVFMFMNTFVFYWVLFFISGINYMILGGIFASWYWTRNKQNVGNYVFVGSIIRTMKYHLGTIAFGSFILTITQLIQLILKFIESILRESNYITTISLNCFRYSFYLLHSFLNILNYNAYIMCAIHGKGLCNSAKNALNLIMRNVVKIFIINTVAEYLFLMAKLLITSLAVGFVCLYYNYNSLNYSPTSIIVTVGVGTYVICSALISVQDVAVNTIFLSFIEDSERNNGSVERPYYMSKKLEKILQK